MHGFDGLAAQDTTTDCRLDLQIRGYLARQAKALFAARHAIEPLFLGAFVETSCRVRSAVLFSKPVSNPVAFEIVKGFSMKS